MKSTEHELI